MNLSEERLDEFNDIRSKALLIIDGKTTVDDHTKGIKNYTERFGHRKAVPVNLVDKFQLQRFVKLEKALHDFGKHY